MTAGKPLTSIGLAKLALQPVVDAVKVKLTLPVAIGETTPALDTAATLRLEDVQLPPDEGFSCNVLPIQTLLAADETLGLAFTVTDELASDAQPVSELVKIKLAVPALTPVMTPALLIVATPGAELVHVPPMLGVMVVVPPSHKVEDTGWVIDGLLFTIIVTSLLSSAQILPVSLVYDLLNL